MLCKFVRVQLGDLIYSFCKPDRTSSKSFLSQSPSAFCAFSRLPIPSALRKLFFQLSIIFVFLHSVLHFFEIFAVIFGERVLRL